MINMGNDRSIASAQRRDFLLSELNDAYYQAHGAESGQDLRRANEMLQAVLEKLKDKTHPMLHEDHDACWQKWVSIKETIKYRRQFICDFNYGKFKGEAYEAKGLAEEFPREAKEKVKETQRAMKGRTMDRWQFDEINTVLEEAFQTASGILRRRYEAGQEKMREAKSRKLGRIDHLRDIVSNIQRDIDNCRDKQRDARSSEFANTVQGWIDEKYDKIRDIENTIRELEDVVRDIDSKLD
jgi:hypothetical protein